MKFRFKKLFAILCFIACLLMVLPISVFADSNANYDILPYQSYTYWIDLSSDGSKKAVPIQSLYEPNRVIENSNITELSLKAIEDVFCSNSGYTYILDKELPAIIVLDGNYNTVNVIKELKNADGDAVSFAGSEGLFVNNSEELYICGTTKECVWITDYNGNIKKTLNLPEADIIPADFTFEPSTLAVDSKGYTYVLSKGSYYGSILYSPEGEFLGFYGANVVDTSIASVFSNIWNKFFVNDEKKSAMVKKLPFQITDLDVGQDDFIYTTTGATNTSTKGQIKILNPAGINIIKNKSYDFSDGAAIKLSKQTWIDQNLSQLTVAGNYIFVLDTGRGKVFVYDKNTNLLGVFGGGMKDGKQKGMFKYPVAIAVNGDDLVIADKTKSSITIYKKTKFGKLVMEAQDLTLAAKYLDAKDVWNEVIKIDKNYQLAYHGLARAELREGNYEKAMELAEIAADRETYSEAYSFHRKNIIVENFVWFFPLLLLLIAAFIVWKIIAKRKNIKFKEIKGVSHFFYTLFHPFDGFGRVIEKREGSCIIGTVMVVILYISQVLSETYSGFAYSYFDPLSFNSLFILAKTVGIVVLWTLVNWAVSTLFGGLGTIRNIYIVITYSLAPLIASNFLYLILSNFVLETEASFLNIMVTVAWIYLIFLLVAGTIKVQDFGFGKFVGTSILTIVGILIVLFLVFIAFLLMQQLVLFVATLFNELIYR